MLKYATTIIISLAAGMAAGVWVLAPSDMGTEAASGEVTTYRCPMHPTVVSDHAGSCPICGMDLVPDQAAGPSPGSGGERKVAYWRAPMDPTYVRDEPGKSPMGMDLVPVYEDELAQEGTVRIDPVTVQNIGVKTAAVVRRPLTRTIRTVGRVDYDERRMSDVNTKIAGWVEKLHVDYTGQMVRKGQPLLEIYSPELVAAQEEYLTALEYRERLDKTAREGVVQGAGDLLEAAAKRLGYWDITEGQIAELRESRQVKRTMTVYSPQEGIVIHKAVFEGQHIGVGQHLYRIGGLDEVWVYADVYEYELPWIRQGQQAAVQLSYLPGRTFHGRVTYIYPYLEAKTRTVKVRMQFANPDMELKPEMYANVTLAAPVSRRALVVPVQAVIHSGERKVAIVSLGGGRFQPRDIVVGVEAEGHYEVLKGLHEGDVIVTSSQFLIDSESNLKAAVGAMVGAGGGGGAGHDGSSVRSDATGPGEATGRDGRPMVGREAMESHGTMESHEAMGPGSSPASMDRSDHGGHQSHESSSADR